MDALLGFQQRALHLVAARLLGAAEQLLLKLVEHLLQAAREFVGEETEYAFQQRLLAAGEIALGDFHPRQRRA